MIFRTLKHGLTLLTLCMTLQITLAQPQPEYPPARFPQAPPFTPPLPAITNSEPAAEVSKPPPQSPKLPQSLIFFYFFDAFQYEIHSIDRFANIFNQPELRDLYSFQILSFIHPRPQTLTPGAPESFKYYCQHENCDFLEDKGDLYLAEILHELCLFKTDQQFWFDYVQNVSIYRQSLLETVCGTNMPTKVCLNGVIEKIRPGLVESIDKCLMDSVIFPYKK